MKVETVSLAKYSTSDMTHAFNQAFEDYIIGSPNFTEEDFASFFSTNFADINLSKFILADNTIKGLALVSRYDNTSRLATMGILPNIKKKGLGMHLLNDLINDAKKRNDKKFVLEVIEQNTPAVKLYEKSGFKTISRLHGFEINNPSSTEKKDDTNITETDLTSLIIFNLQMKHLNLPWQISMPNIIRINKPDRIFKSGNAFTAISNPEKKTVQIKTLLSLGDKKVEYCKKLLQGLFSLYPGRIWKANVHYPDEYVPLFQQLGFQKHKLTQFQMEIPLKGFI